MKSLSQFLAGSIFVLGVMSATAGTVFYQAIPASQSDANSGISGENGYTSAVDGGNTRATDRVINGITLYSLKAQGQSATANNCTLNALSGNLSNGGGKTATIQADGTFSEAVSDMTFNNGATDNSQQEIVLEPDSLEAGTTYDLRIYVCNSSGQDRQVNLSFVGDGQAAVETGWFNEDDARSSAGGFQDANQAYYINYRFTWDGDSTPGITITQKSGRTPFVLYALTNQVVPGGAGEATADAGSSSQSEGEGEGEGEGLGQGEGDGGMTVGLVNNESDQVGVESDDFYQAESLNSNGRWVDVGKWGRCWQPTNVASGWSPYTNGTWNECDDCGWTFNSDEPWAWACYHYGRWCKVRSGCGWAWVPGKTWGASWVSWRRGRDESCSCIGWAPLPPEAGCEVGVGISSWVDTSCNIGPDCYTFVHIRDFGAGSYWGCGCIYERSRNSTIIIDTFNCTNICYNKHVNIYCGGPDFNWCNTEIRKHGGKECSKVYVNRYDDPSKMGGKMSKHEGNKLALASPHIKGDGKGHRPKAAESLGGDKIEHGWSGKNKKQEQQLRNHLAQENKGRNPKNSPAKLPDGVAQKMGKHHGGQGAGDGQAGAGTGAGNMRHPGGKGNKGMGTESLGAGGNNGVGQHPGGKKGFKGQGQMGNVGAGSQGATQNMQGNVGGGNAGGGHHPGQSLKGMKHGQGAGSSGQQGGSAGTGGQQGGGSNVMQGQGGGQGKHHGKVSKQTGSAGNQAAGSGSTSNMQGGTGQGGGGGGGGSGKGRHKQQSQTTSNSNPNSQQGQTQGAGTGQGAGGGKHRKQQSLNQHSQAQGGQNYGQQTSGAGAGGGGGGGGGGKHHKQQSQQQQQQQTQNQGYGQTMGAGGGGGGGGGGRGRHQQTQNQQQQYQQQQRQPQQHQQQQGGGQQQGGKKKNKQYPY